MKKLKNKIRYSPYMKAQYGTGFNYYNPMRDADNFLNIPKAAFSSYLAGRSVETGFAERKYGGIADKEERERMVNRDANRAGLFSGALGAINATASIIGERNAWRREQERIAKLNAGNYYQMPYDEYSYNQESINPYNATAYKKGGLVRLKPYKKSKKW